MSGRRTAALAAVMAFTVIGLLSACAPQVTAWDPWGNTMAQLQKHAPPTGSIVYDISPTLVGVPAEYNEGADQSKWVIVAACGPVTRDATGPVAVAVIPRSRYSAAIRSKTLAHDYTTLLAECR